VREFGAGVEFQCGELMSVMVKLSLATSISKFGNVGH
jgi:hypothetical protein